MKTLKSIKLAALVGIMAAALGGCQDYEDARPERLVEADYSIIDFDRLEMGDGLSVTVRQGSEYSIHAEGDERNVEDLVVKRSGSKLEVEYRNGLWNIRRKYRTYVTIVMPKLVAADFSGAVTADLGAIETEGFHLGLSGASTVTMSLAATQADFDLSGASDLTVTGSASNMDASLSGASRITANEFAVQSAQLVLSGASFVKVNAAETLNVRASGASDVIYRGTPALSVSLSGSSNVKSE